VNDSESSASESAGVINEKTHEGIRFTFTVEMVSGEEGKQLAMTQARAIRGLPLLASKVGQPARRTNPGK
jgi:hypothetical protein